MKTLSDKGTATVADFSNGKDGSTNVDLNYNYSYVELESAEELAAKFSTLDLLKLANRNLKATANSAERQKAIAPYAADPNSPAMISKRMLKDLIALGLDEDTAKGMVEAAISQGKK